MARLPRYFVSGQTQHIIQRGNNREPIFADLQDYLFYLECLQEAAERNNLQVHAYVLMTNHVHILATPANKDSISKTLQSIGRRSVQYFNYTYQRTGTLWEGRYKATIIDSEQYLLSCMRYIELNPVRANMVNHPNQYKWSSYATNAEGAANLLITPHELYDRLDHNLPSRQKAYRLLFSAAINRNELENIRKSTNNAWVLGNTIFQQEIEQLSKRRAAPKPRTDQKVTQQITLMAKLPTNSNFSLKRNRFSIRLQFNSSLTPLIC